MNLDFLTQSGNNGTPPIGGPTLAQSLTQMGQGLGSGNLSSVMTGAPYALSGAGMTSMVPSFDPRMINASMISSDAMKQAMDTGATGGFGDLGFADKASLILGGLNTIGNLWGGFEARGMAKKQFDFTKDFAETNLANSMKEYNTRLADRARARAHTEGRTQASADAYVSENKLSRTGS